MSINNIDPGSGSSIEKVSILQAKKTIRAEARRTRKSIGEAARKWKNERILERLAGSEEFTNSRTICIYWSLPEEVDTHDLLARLLGQGKRVCMPCHTQEVCLKQIDSIEQDLLEGRSEGILEPKSECRTISFEDVDCFLVPGLAFDLFGRRIGFGGGYYDRYLSGKRKDAHAIALAYRCQMFSDIPFDPSHDRLVDSVVTEEATYRHRVKSQMVLSHEQTVQVASSLAGVSEGGLCLRLHGPLGVGKTVFVKGFLQGLGGSDEVSSPSFVLMNEYLSGRLPVRHIDLYRLGDRPLAEGDLQMFFESVDDFEGIVLVEWPEYGENWLPLGAPLFRFEFLQDNTRIITLETFKDERISLSAEFERCLNH